MDELERVHGPETARRVQEALRQGALHETVEHEQEEGEARSQQQDREEGEEEEEEEEEAAQRILFFPSPSSSW